MSEKQRAYLYRITTAAIALLVVYGVLDEGTAAEWAILAAAVLGVGEGVVAAANTPTDGDG